MRCRARILSALMLVALPLEAAPPTPPAAECTRGSGPALGEMACEIARALGERAERSLVVALRPTGDGALAPRPELGARLSELVAGALGREASGWPTAEPPERITALPWRARPLVVLHAHVEGERVRVTADWFTSYPRLWQRARREKLGPAAHAVAERGIDGEVRAFLPRIPLAAKNVHRATGADRDVVALACGDVDRDGSPEIATIGRTRITLGRLAGNVFRPFASRPFAELAPIAPAPFREPIASAWVPEPGVLEVGTTDRARALRLDGKLAKVRELDARLPWPGGGGLETAELGDAIDAVAGATLVTRAGEIRRVRAERRPDGTVKLSDGKRSAELERLGAQLAVGDLDGDGEPELVASLDTLDAASDALVVYSWNDGRKPVERLRIPAPGGVRALAVCKARATQMAPIAAAVGDALWVVE
ncbi:MAG TPA: hypothetical protein VFZ53_31405 [Polyangiaceae bacterium]